MARVWKETLPLSEGDLVPPEVICVRVCGFTFRFHSLAQVRDALDFYSRKTHPSSRISRRDGFGPDGSSPDFDAAVDVFGYNAERVGRARRLFRSFLSSHHTEVQRWYERVPLYLQEEGKRQKVVAALSEALQTFSDERGSRGR